ncbi:MAG: hypothetical protein AAF514_11710 [Verrucomicrobiota bacterium]
MEPTPAHHPACGFDALRCPLASLDGTGRFPSVMIRLLTLRDTELRLSAFHQTITLANR